MNKILIRSVYENPRYGLILIHGRGATAEDIKGIADELKDDTFIYAAPEAPLNTWYPLSFLAPVEQNEPYLSNSLGIINNLIMDLNKKGIPREKIIFAGFSQGACLSLEFILRNPAKFGGIAAFSGASISFQVDQGVHQRLENTPVFLGCSERDPHIPKERVDITEKIFKKMGAHVLKKIYPGSFHGIIEDELNELRKIVENLKNN